MKDYKQFIRQLPNNTIVCALGEFNPPTTAHELLVQTVKVVAEQRGADHIIFTSPSELLHEDKKQQFLSLMFPKSKFASLGEAFFTSVVKKLNEKYKNVIIVAGADQFDEFKKLKESAGVEVISIGTKDPDADLPQMKQFATKGIYEDFKKLLPSTIRDIDGKRLMNEMRIGMNLEPIKEQLNLVKDKLREKYFRGEIFNVGDIVESNGQHYEIVKRGSNHLLVKEETGELVSKWITDVKVVKEGVIQPNGTDKVETNSPEQASNKQDQKPKGKVKGFLTFYNYDDKTKTVNEDNDIDLPKDAPSIQSIADKHGVSVAQIQDQLAMGMKIEAEHGGDKGSAKEIALDHLNEKPDYYTKLQKVEESALNPQDPHGDYQAKRKALQDIQMDPNTHKDPELKTELIRRKSDLEREYSKLKSFKESLQEGKMGQIAADIEDHLGKHLADYKAHGGAEHFASKVSKTHDHIAKLHGLEKKHAVGLVNQYVDSKLNEETLDQQDDRKKQLKRFQKQVAALTPTQDRPGIGTENAPNKDPFFKEEFDLKDEEIDSMVEEVSEEELLGLDEHTEWDLVYEDTDEVIPPHPDEEQIDLMEVLSRQERLRGKIRLRRTQAKRSRTTKINVHRFANPKTINARARRLAIKLIKKRMLRGRSPSKASVGDKERIEKSLHKNKALVDRVAQKLVVRVRKVEKARMSKGKVKKGAMPSVF